MSENLTRKNFNEFYLSEGMLETLAKIGYQTPTPVQAQTIPLVMAGIDLIVQSQTGTGKTAAFAIPLVEMLEPAPGVVEVLVLAPTRELARQVSDEFARLGHFKGIETATIYGGTAYGPQYDALETAQVVVATPGRLLDIADRGRIDLSRLRMFTLDEADEMLSMGFQEEVDRIIAKLPDTRQSLLFSATITPEVEALGKSMLFYPEFITLSTDSVAAEDVTHEYYGVSGVGRTRDLLKVLEYEEPENAIIFANTRGDTFTVTSFLKRHGLRAEVLNGDLPQKERERTLAALKANEIDFLVATDVAARGIDISDLSHVINYTVPESAEVYIHRTGRTGRAGKKGKALSLISPREMATLFNIRKFYGVEMVKQPLPTPNDILEAKKARRLAQLDTRLQDVDSIAYGASLGLARQLVRESETLSETERIRLVARLIALAERVAAGEEVDVPTVADVEAEREATNGVDHAAAADEAEVEEPEELELDDVDLAPSVADVDEADVEDDDDADDEASASLAEPADEADEDDLRESRRDRGGRRRRRRRGGDREERQDRNEDAPVEAEASDEDDADEPARWGNRRRRRRGRGGNDEESSLSITPAAPEPPPQDLRMSKLWVNMGRNHFDAAEEVVEMICLMAGMDPDDLGQVTLGTSFSYVEVRQDYFYDIIEALNNQDWNGVTVSAEPARK